jgi:pimeloyl-ACP methyl ester carboxylesterase
MPTITTADGTESFYKDWGSGQPIVFSHGWPLSSDDWDTQLMFFLLHGYRVVAPDRRGHGRSAQVSDGRAWPAAPRRTTTASSPSPRPTSPGTRSLTDSPRLRQFLASKGAAFTGV